MNNPLPSSILVYARPWSKNQFLDIAENISKEADKIVVSEHKKIDESGLANYFYKQISLSGNTLFKSYLSEEEINEIIIRCRLLRSINRDLAIIYICAMHAAIEMVLEKNAINLVLSLTVDSYVLHLIYISCKRRNIPFVGLVPSFVNGYFRITALGERNHSRNTTKAEIDVVSSQLLNHSYKPKFLGKPNTGKQKAVKSWLRNFIKPVWFYAVKTISGDHLNYHYLATQTVSREYWSVAPNLYTGMRPDSREDLISADGVKKLIFLPLQMSPEATIDYWSNDKTWINYEKKIFNLLDEYASHVVFAVKEHPNVLGNRRRDFYGRLAAHGACRLIDVDVNSNMIIDMCDGVVICTGTVGFEAAIRGKAVYADTSPFHLPPDFLRPIFTLKEKQSDPAEITHLELKKEEEKTDVLLRYLLNGLIPGNFISNGEWNENSNEHKIFNSQIGHSIVEYLELNDKQ